MIKKKAHFVVAKSASFSSERFCNSILCGAQPRNQNLLKDKKKEEEERALQNCVFTNVLFRAVVYALLSFFIILHLILKLRNKRFERFDSSKDFHP